MASLNERLDSLRKQGVVLPRNPQRAVEAIYSAGEMDRELHRHAGNDLRNMELRLGRPITADNYDSPEVRRVMDESNAMAKAMGNKRALSSRMQRTAAMGGNSTGVGPQGALPRWYDPMEYWDLSGLPWNVADEGHRHKLHKWLRLYYATHYLIPILVDIFTRFPLVGMELECKDPALTTFYEELFFDQLNYEDFLVSLGREFWVVGEAFPLGSFDENLGVWEREELINPEDVIVDTFPILGSQQLKIRPPDYLKRLAQTKTPPKEWRLLDANFPELIPYLLKGENIPVSDVLMRHVGNKLNDWDEHGTPILLRGLRTLIHEEKLLASQDATAERLYSPLLLAKLGIQDMGDGQPPWIPGPDELESVRDDLDVALSSDFRVMVHHFGLELSSVFGREQMPRLGDDFDRIERRLMQVFGVNPSLLSAGSGGQPYASSALQAEFLNQILRTFQKMLKDHFRARALTVAEAQKHYDYEVRGQTRVQLFEEIALYDEENNQRIVEVPKLLIPDLKFKTLDLRDEATERQFLQSLRQLGVPIPDARLAVGIDWDFEDMVREYNRELKEKTITQQQAKFDTYTALTIKGLPIPADLRAEVESVLQPPGGMQPAGGQQPAMPGADPGPSAGPGGAIMMPNPPTDLGPGGDAAVPGGGPPPAGPVTGPAGSVPEISNERRPGLTYNTSVDYVEQSGDLVKQGSSPADVGHAMRQQLIREGHTEAEAEGLIKTWLEYVLGRKAHDVSLEDLPTEHEAATLDESEPKEVETVPLEEWELKPNQEVRPAEDSLPERITEKRRKGSVKFDVKPEKKYAFIDPEAEELESE
jgi:hypothetical protein